MDWSTKLTKSNFCSGTVMYDICFAPQHRVAALGNQTKELRSTRLSLVPNMKLVNLTATGTAQIVFRRQYRPNP